MGFGVGASHAVGLQVGAADAVGVVTVDPRRGLGLGLPGPAAQRGGQIAVPRGGGPPTGRGVGLPACRLLPGGLALGGSGPPARRGRPPVAGTARVVVLTRSVTVLSRGGGSGLPCFTHRALLGRPR
ncbi:hypothetical protein F4558_005950 [Micromonospora profundi]|nr:hypothetical protein [Micromonospora profundi]